MLNDNIPDEYIIAYILKCGYKGTLIQLKGVIYKVAKNNNIKDTRLIFIANMNIQRMKLLLQDINY